MAILSKLGTTTLLVTAGLCFATAAAIIYILTKEETLYEEREKDLFYSSRHTVIEVAVPSDLVGAIIGRHGSSIKQIQDKTNTVINFKDQISGEGARIAVIRGKPLDAQNAESLVRNAMADMLKVTSIDVLIPSSACGNVIGTNGNNIHMISDVSKARVYVERCYDGGTSATTRRVTIKGTETQIEMAKALIEEAVAEAETHDKRRRNEKLYITAHDQEASRSNERRTEELVATAQDGFIEVFVSVVDSPHRFWVQPIGVKAKELDKLVSDMTDYYVDETNTSNHQILEKLDVGTLVAVPFQYDETWYRGTVTEYEEDEYDPSESKVRFFYVDFGGEATMKRNEIYSLHSEFHHLSFQAIECSLHNVEPKGGDIQWTKEATALFEKLIHNSQWEVIMLKIVQGKDEEVKQVELVDTRGSMDTNVAETMITSGIAQRIQSE